MFVLTRYSMHNTKTINETQKDRKSTQTILQKHLQKREVVEPRTKSGFSLGRSKSRLQHIFKILLSSSILPLLILDCQCSQSLVLDEIRVSSKSNNENKGREMIISEQRKLQEANLGSF